MADHSARIEALEEALASGELTIKVDGKETTYRSTKDLLSALDYFRSRGVGASGRLSGSSTLATFG